MRKSKFTTEQIKAILTEQENGVSPVEICERHGISRGTFYKWKGKYGEKRVLGDSRVQTLLLENHRLKQLLAEAELEKAALKELLESN